MYMCLLPTFSTLLCCLLSHLCEDILPTCQVPIVFLPATAAACPESALDQNIVSAERQTDNYNLCSVVLLSRVGAAVLAHPVGAGGAHAEELRVLDILETHFAPEIYPVAEIRFVNTYQRKMLKIVCAVEKMNEHYSLKV